MSEWQRASAKELRRIGVNGDVLFAHLAKASHVRRPGEAWRKETRALLPSSEAIAILLRPFTPVGKLRPTSKDVPAAFGAIWAAPEVASASLLSIVAELVPWCRMEYGTSHQAAALGAMALGVWPDDTRAILEKFRDDSSMSTILPTVKASLRRQNEAHPKR